MSTNLVQGVVQLGGSQVPLPSGSAAQASNSVVVTDAAGTVFPAQVLTGMETPAWSWAATYAAGSASAVVQALDVNGAAIGGPVTLTFSVAAGAPTTFFQANGISFTPASSSPAAAAIHAALVKAAKK